MADDDDPLLTAPEQAAYLGVGPTRFAELEKLADFPPALWLGNRGKRRLKSQLRAWALAQTTRPPGKASV